MSRNCGCNKNNAPPVFKVTTQVPKEIPSTAQQIIPKSIPAVPIVSVINPRINPKIVHRRNQKPLPRTIQRTISKQVPRSKLPKKIINKSTTVSIQPVPVQPVPVQPVPIQPVPIQPVPIQPVPIQPVPIQPVPIQPVPIQPVPTIARVPFKFPTISVQQLPSAQVIPKVQTVQTVSQLQPLQKASQLQKAPTLPTFAPSVKGKFANYTSAQLRSWDVIHKKARDAVTDEAKKEFIEYLDYLSKSFPCGKCTPHIKNYLKDYPIPHDEIIENGNFIAFSRWSWEFHNNVNKRLNKKTLTWEQFKNTYFS